MDDKQTQACVQEQALRAEIARSNKIITALMNRAERDMNANVSDFSLFQNSITLENRIRGRTAEMAAPSAKTSASIATCNTRRRAWSARSRSAAASRAHWNLKKKSSAS